MESQETLKKIKQSKDSLLAIFDNLGGGICVIDSDFKVARANQTILNIFGKSTYSEILEKKCYQTFWGSDQACANCPVQKVFEKDRPYHVNEIIQGQDNKRVSVDITAFPIKDDQGKIVKVIKYTKFIKKKEFCTQDQFLHHDRLISLGELAPVMAHELRNPLTNIYAAAQFLVEKIPQDDYIKKHLQLILRNSERANVIINDLLNFIKPQELIFKLTNIKNVINSACSLIKTKALKNKVTISKNFQNKIPRILIDEKQIEEVFLNIIINSLDAMPAKGKLSISLSPDYQDKQLTIKFADTGCGISEENISKVFNPFFTTKKAGTGVGLFFARQIINLHGGGINIESRLGIGTQITISLPIPEGIN